MRQPTGTIPTSRALTRRAFVGSATALAAVVPGLARSASAQPRAARGKLLAYVGTYSSPPAAASGGKGASPRSNGRGVHIFAVDRATGALSPAGVVDNFTSPSALVFDASGTYAYTTNATDNADSGASGTVGAYRVDRATGHLTPLNTVASGGLGPTHASIHPNGRHLLVANYAGGSVAVLPILDGGRLGSATQVVRTTGTVGPTRAEHAPPGSFAFSGHDAPHPHMIETDPAGRFVLAPDLGLDRIFVWAFDAAAGTLTPADPPSVALPPGDGPRHFAFHPKGSWLYSIQEEGSTLVLFDYDATRGRLTSRQTISSLPPGYAGSNFCSGIRVSPDGRFVYAGNRLHDSIGIFSIGRDGTLTFVDAEQTRGSYPRSFTIDPTGNFLYSCNQRADNVTAFRVDRQSGTLTFTGRYTAVGNPSDLVFLELGDV